MTGALAGWLMRAACLAGFCHTTAASSCAGLVGEVCEGSEASSLIQYTSKHNRTVVYGVGDGDEDWEEEGFACDEAFEEWRRGWSWMKIKWCCKHEGIACREMDEHNATGPPPTTNITLEPTLNAEGVLVDVIVEVQTADKLDAESSTGASMAFMVGAHWTQELELCRSAAKGETVVRMVRLPAWPARMRITALGEDSLGYDSIVLYFTDNKGHTMRLVVLGDHAGTVNASDSQGSLHWVGGSAAASKHIFDVPALPADLVPQKPCHTRYDVRAQAMGFETSPPGTLCVFGADDADEGSHCIQDDQYGSYGWCYTKSDRSSWGACSEDCPLTGQFQIIGVKLDEVLRRLARKEAEGAATTSMPAEVNATTPAEVATLEPTPSTSAGGGGHGDGDATTTAAADGMQSH